MTSEWIALDWGTSRLRAWHIAPDGTVLGEASSDAGMGTLSRDGFEPALLDLVADWLPDSGTIEVLACGMVGAREGWAEAGYASVPCPPCATPLTRAPTNDKRLNVHIIPGLSQATPADVMRGEETQIAGYLAETPGFDGVICLPGTHTKWALISAGEVVSFATAMTGDLFAAISKHTVLRHALAQGEAWDEAAFLEAVADGQSQPERLATRLFGIRAEGLLAAPSPGRARARASGLLIGAELAAMRPYWLGQALTIIGADGMAHLYELALGAQGLAPQSVDAGQMTRAGLIAARALLET